MLTARGDAGGRAGNGCRRLSAQALRAAPWSGGAKSDILRFGRLEIDRGSREVRLDGAPCALTSYQFALLLALAEHAGRVMSRDALMDLVKGRAMANRTAA
jgi:DNA-binding response OmpR family regulator